MTIEFDRVNKTRGRSVTIRGSFILFVICPVGLFVSKVISGVFQQEGWRLILV